MEGIRDDIDGLLESLGQMEPATRKAQTSSSVNVSCDFKPKFKLKHVTISHLLDNWEAFLGQQVTVVGWVQTSRQGRFIQLSDGSCMTDVQVVANPDDPEQADVVKNLSRHCSLKVVGKVVKSGGKGQDIDVEVISIKMLGSADKKYPLPKGQTLTMDTLREFQHLRARTMVIRAAQKVRNEACKATHDFFYEHGFQYIHTPLITAADCEGAGEAFTVTTMLDHKGEPATGSEIPVTADGKVDFSKDFFKGHACLTVSGQLHVETYAHGIGSVYTFGPTFRAENSHTNRHLAEFWMIEPEVAFCEFTDVQDLAEDYLKYCLARFLTNCRDELDYLGKRYAKDKADKRQDNVSYITSIAEADFARVTYTDGVQMLIDTIESKKIKVLMTEGKYAAVLEEARSASHVDDSVVATLEKWKDNKMIETYSDSTKMHVEGWKVLGPKKMRKRYSKYIVFENPVFWGVDLSSEHEKYLTEHITNRPTILTHYPTAIKSFYMKQNEDGRTVQACDVLVPGVGEVIGGSQREDDLKKLEARVRDIGIDPKEMSWYLDLRRYGSVPHGGFGLGLERLLMLATGVDNIRDIIPFPRYPGKCQY